MFSSDEDKGFADMHIIKFDLSEGSLKDYVNNRSQGNPAWFCIISPVESDAHCCNIKQSIYNNRNSAHST